MTENEIGTVVIEVAISVHRELGPGLLESVYEAVLAHELRGRGLAISRQTSIPVRYKELKIGAPVMKDGIERIVNGLSV